jgi:hydrogenase expression/formation protein HypC
MCLGLPGRVESIEATETLLTGVVDFGGLRRDVCLATVPDVEVGDYVVVHVGFALSIIDETHADRMWNLLESTVLSDRDVNEITDFRSLPRPGPATTRSV